MYTTISMRISTKMNASPMNAYATDAPTCVHVRVWAHTYPRRTVRTLSVGVDRLRLGLQAFQSASAFNADIGAWNIASVTSLGSVCASFGRQRAPRRMLTGCARSVFDAARLLCAAASPMRTRTCVHTLVGTRLRGCPHVYAQLRSRKMQYT